MRERDRSDHATVGIAAHYHRASRKGAWAVVIRMKEREVTLHGCLKRAGLRDSERHAVGQALLTLQRLRAPLAAIEVTHDVKRALSAGAPRTNAAHEWREACGLWRVVSKGAAGIRVQRKPGDAYQEALRLAEITGITGTEKLHLTEAEKDTTWNRAYRHRQAEKREERAATRAQRNTQRRHDGANEYAIATGREAPRPGYRPPRSVRPVMSRAHDAFFAAPALTKDHTSLRPETATLEELMSLLERL